MRAMTVAINRKIAMTATAFGLGSIGFSGAVEEGGFGFTGIHSRRNTPSLEDLILLPWQ